MKLAVQAAPGSAYNLVETKPPLPAKLGPRGAAMAATKMASTYDMVEQMEYLYVSVVKARDLPTMDITGALDPYVDVKLGNFEGVTKHLVKNPNPVWRQAFAFSGARLQSNQLEVIVKDKDMVRDDFVGRVVFDMSDIPERLPPDSPLAPQWYSLSDAHGERFRHSHSLGEIMLAVWTGTQADEAFPEACHSDAHPLSPEGLTNTRSKVYYSPKLIYLEGPTARPHYRQDPDGQPDPSDAAGAAAGEPGVKRRLHVRGQRAVRGPAGGDGAGEGRCRERRTHRPHHHARGVKRAAQRPGQVGAIEMVQPVARDDGGR